ncbi:hypothetical protein BDS110ZK25_32330 [Bradyrhizobium diazoefficiens]|uniref:Uncharacterized protein n=1 Tax=Bradyrhizobium diazoefficiens TaxID=1355477 RepID=A0A809ZWY5_9BRAD|nr:hypothetical protein F07S3_49160 [Bradyrhizobium diazoefficiens]BCA04120.1 hypothetical protein H12S4_50240 [Bradyrhizobium diazoefficiens]BCA12766.1 hypothetical protein BDHF08_46130 [Bradyrhizobium diazoefficiens]BCA21479.1 hypothetical protein BDHH15_46940 [Bradyrhizobium diazoefficiens]BCE22046.1 hypothetical protein XF1B_47270 [Bradyrhizobium diazoefficiens]
MSIAGSGNEPADPGKQSGYRQSFLLGLPPRWQPLFSAAHLLPWNKNPASIAEDTDGAFVLGLHRIAEASHLQFQPPHGDFVPPRIDFF